MPLLLSSYFFEFSMTSSLTSLPSGRSRPPMVSCFSMLSLFLKFDVFLAHHPVQLFFLGLLLPQSALEFCPIHCPNGRLGQDLGFGGSAFALKLPELLNRNLVAVRAKLGQTSCFPN